MRLLRVPAVVFLAILIGSACSGVSHAGSPAASTETTATTVTTAGITQPRVDVAVIGDSLIASTTDEVAAAIGADGYTVSVAGSPGVPLTDPFIQQHLDAAVGTPIIVNATATNDNFANDDASVAQGQTAASTAYR